MAVHACRISTAMATAICNAIVDAIDVGGAHGHLVIYTGTMPTHCDDTAATVVATCELASPAYGAASYEVSTHTADAELAATATCASATGNASAVTHYRLISAGGNAILQGTCSATAGDDLVLNAAIIATASEVNITSLIISVPIDQT